MSGRQPALHSQNSWGGHCKYRVRSWIGVLQSTETLCPLSACPLYLSGLSLARSELVASSSALSVASGLEPLQQFGYSFWGFISPV